MALALQKTGYPHRRPARLTLLCPCLFVCLMVFCLPATVFAEESAWDTVIAGHEAAPPRVVAVDKKRQQIFLFERHSPLRLKNTYLCTTGQAPGDKMTRGDLKTPEGVYFVVQHVTSGLDFTMYGNEAYTLNYPNPVDRLRSKTGYGIWIHGRGEPITPLQTQGCVAMNNPDLALLGDALPPGTPVILTASFSQAPATDPIGEKNVRELVGKTQAWSDAWGSRSSKMFSYYEPDAYSQTTESFSAFKTQKERLFKMLPWIKSSIKNVQVLEGPGYWVTWFYQEYSAPNLSTKGVRRLYWQEFNGELRIVGMEWAPGMSTGTLVASADPAMPPVDVAPRTEEQDSRAAAPASAAPVPAGVAPSAPSTPEASATAAPTTGGAHPALLAGLKLPPPIPAQGLNPSQMPVDSTAPAVPAGKPDETLAVDRSPTTAAPMAESTDVEPVTEETTPRALPAGVTVAETSPKPKAVENPSDDIRRTVETWRAAWQKGDLSAYMNCYTQSAVQGDRKGSEAIRDQKEDLWKRRAPAKVSLSDISVAVSGERARVEMRQDYTDAKGNSDAGKKTLTLERRKNVWRITSEDWRPAR